MRDFDRMPSSLAKCKVHLFKSATNVGFQKEPCRRQIKASRTDRFQGGRSVTRNSANFLFPESFEASFLPAAVD